MFRICDSITNNILKKNFQYSTYLFVHKTRHSLYTSTTGKTPYGWFCNPLHAVTKDLSVTFCTSFPESFSSFTTSRHDSVDALCFAANTHNPLFKTGCTLQQVSPTLQAWKAPGRPQIDCWVCNKYYVGVITRGWYQTLVSIPGMGFLVWDFWYGIPGMGLLSPAPIVNLTLWGYIIFWVSGYQSVNDEGKVYYSRPPGSSGVPQQKVRIINYLMEKLFFKFHFPGSQVWEWLTFMTLTTRRIFLNWQGLSLSLCLLYFSVVVILSLSPTGPKRR